MKYKLMSVKIRDLFDEYQNDEEEGVFGYHGKLNIRPKFQREFCYRPEQQNAVIESIINKRPLNLFYWSKNEDDTYELKIIWRNISMIPQQMIYGCISKM